MATRSKSDSEEKTIVNIEVVAANLRKQVDNLETLVNKLREHRETTERDGSSGKSE